MHKIQKGIIFQQFLGCNGSGTPSQHENVNNAGKKWLAGVWPVIE
jgi:hypothetical protein